jgi:transcriptional antiterminator RfaH
MHRWHLIYTKPRQEEEALHHLLNQNFKAYPPLIKREKILRGKKVTVNEPLFTRYLFISLNDDGSQNWTPIRSTRGVSHKVRFGNQDATLPDDLIDTLQARINQGPTKKDFTPGDRVEIFKGPLKGIEAIFETYCGDKCAILLLDFMTRELSAKLDVVDFKKHH